MRKTLVDETAMPRSVIVDQKRDIYGAALESPRQYEVGTHADALETISCRTHYHNYAEAVIGKSIMPLISRPMVYGSLRDY